MAAGPLTCGARGRSGSTCRATDGGSKDDAAHRRAVILALWSSHCRAENRPKQANSADSLLLPKNLLFSVARWEHGKTRQAEGGPAGLAAATEAGTGETERGSAGCAYHWNQPYGSIVLIQPDDSHISSEPGQGASTNQATKASHTRQYEQRSALPCCAKASGVRYARSQRPRGNRGKGEAHAVQ